MKKIGLSFQSFIAIISFSIAGSVIYELPYIKYVYYDKLLEAFHMTNAQAGFLLSAYAIGCMVLYIPGGIVADKFSTKKMLVLSLFSTGVLGFILAFSMNYITALIVFFIRFLHQLCFLDSAEQRLTADWRQRRFWLCLRLVLRFRLHYQLSLQFSLLGPVYFYRRCSFCHVQNHCSHVHCSSRRRSSRPSNL